MYVTRVIYCYYHCDFTNLTILKLIAIKEFRANITVSSRNKWKMYNTKKDIEKGKSSISSRNDKNSVLHPLLT